MHLSCGNPKKFFPFSFGRLFDVVGILSLSVSQSIKWHFKPRSYCNIQFENRTIPNQIFLSVDSFSSALLVRLEDHGDEDGDGDGDDFFQNFWKKRKNLPTDLFRRST